MFSFEAKYPIKMVMSRSVLQNVLTKLHIELGHAEMSKLERAARTQLWMPYLRKDMGFCRNCHRCVSFESPDGARRARLKPRKLVKDVVGPISKTLGQCISTRPRRPFHQIMRGCILELSGFENWQTPP